MILAGICDQDWHLRIFIKNLLDPAIVNTLPGVLLTCGAIFGLILGIAQVFGMSNIIRRFIARLAAGGRS
jgi:hypothetical protein